MSTLPSEEEVLFATFNGQMAAGAGLIAAAVIAHCVALFTLRRFIIPEEYGLPVSKWKPLSLKGGLFTVLTVLALVTLHLVEIVMFAVFYEYVRALPNFQEALYFSTISYATIGYSDAAIANEWRMVAALEGLVGVILLGWSTAFFVRVLGKLEGE